jgi:hypothetical protein
MWFGGPVADTLSTTEERRYRMSYHASGKPTLRSGSILVVPPKVRASVPFGDSVKASAYGAGSDWTPALLKDVELRYDRGRARRAKVRKTPVGLDRAAAERKLAGTVRMAEVD